MSTWHTNIPPRRDGLQTGRGVTGGALHTMVLILVTVGLGCERPGAPGAPAIKFGKDLCAVCEMVINDEASAAAVRVRAGAGEEFRLFDDIGELFDFEAEDDSPPVLERYVHDHSSKRWLLAGGATFVMGDKVPTPMSSGIAAFDDAAAARTFADKHGARLLTLEEARLARRAWRDARLGK